MDHPPVFLLTGCPGCGKTTTATALVRRFPFGVRISVDDLRDQVVSGMAGPLPEWTKETTRQFTLARRSAGLMAREYAEAGFAVAIEDVGGPEEFGPVFEPLGSLRVQKVLLHPPANVCVDRARTRTNKNFDPTRLCAAIPRIHAWVDGAFRETDGWLRIDNAEMGLDTVVDEILARTR